MWAGPPPNWVVLSVVVMTMSGVLFVGVWFWIKKYQQEHECLRQHPSRSVDQLGLCQSVLLRFLPHRLLDAADICSSCSFTSEQEPPPWPFYKTAEPHLLPPFLSLCTHHLLIPRNLLAMLFATPTKAKFHEPRCQPVLFTSVTSGVSKCLLHAWMNKWWRKKKSSWI